MTRAWCDTMKHIESFEEISSLRQICALGVPGTNSADSVCKVAGVPKVYLDCDWQACAKITRPPLASKSFW